MNYECLRCGYSSLKKNDVKKHINKKNICDPVYTNTPQNVCLSVLMNNNYKLGMDLFKRQLKEIKNLSVRENEIISNLKKEIKESVRENENLIEEIDSLRSENDKLKEKIKSLECHKDVPEQSEFIYILQEREFHNNNENVYKVGRTKGFKNRMGCYPKGSKIKLVYPCEDSENIEKELLNIFDLLFCKRTDIGNEYYQGKIKDMCSTVTVFISNKNA